MTDLQIKYILSVARLRSFTLAAETNHIRQPAISAQIKSAERELGFDVFTRGHGPITLTSAGQELVTWLDETSSSYTNMQKRALALSGNKKLTLTLGVLGYCHYPPLCEAICMLRSHRPDIHIHMEVLGPHELISAAAKGDYDAIFGESDIADKLPSYTFRKLGKMEWVIIFSRFSDHASDPNLNPSSFVDDMFIGPGDIKDNQTGLLPFHGALFKDCSYSYPRVVPAINVESTILQIQCGLGVGFCSKAYADSLADTIAYYDAKISSDIGIAIPSSKNIPQVQALIKNLEYCIARYNITEHLQRGKYYE